jgi:hypothetical protein
MGAQPIQGGYCQSCKCGNVRELGNTIWKKDAQLSYRYYKALTFYLQEHPTLLTDLLTVLTPRIDHSRVVRMFSRKDNDNVPLIRSYLVAVQHVSYKGQVFHVPPFTPLL